MNRAESGSAKALAQFGRLDRLRLSCHSGIALHDRFCMGNTRKVTVFRGATRGKQDKLAGSYAPMLSSKQ